MPIQSEAPIPYFFLEYILTYYFVVLILTWPNPLWLICQLTVPAINGTAFNAPGIPKPGAFFRLNKPIKKAEPSMLCQYKPGSPPLRPLQK
jgi:hypothetical protein